MYTYEPLPGVICPACKRNPVVSNAWVEDYKRRYQPEQTFVWSDLACAWLCPNCKTPYQDACDMANVAPHYRTEENQSPIPAKKGNSLMPKKSGKPMMQLSHSQIETWEKCAYKWKLQKVDKVLAAPAEALIFGTALHAALEADGNQIIAGLGPYPDYLLLAAFDTALKEALAASYPFSLLAKAKHIAMRARAQDIITRYIEKVQPTFRPLEVEQDFSFEIDGRVQFRGRIDAITSSSIVDWKTASAPWTPGEQHEKDQATAYLIARPEASRVSFAVFAGEGDSLRFQSLPTERTEAQKEAYKARVLAIADEIEAAKANDDFPANPGIGKDETGKWLGNCHRCEYLGHCTAGQAWLKMKGKVPQVPVITQRAIDAYQERHQVAEVESDAID